LHNLSIEEPYKFHKSISSENYVTCKFLLHFLLLYHQVKLIKCHYERYSELNQFKALASLKCQLLQLYLQLRILNSPIHLVKEVLYNEGITIFVQLAIFSYIPYSITLNNDDKELRLKFFQNKLSISKFPLCFSFNMRFILILLFKENLNLG